MLGTPRARANGPAFVVGWVAGLAVVGTAVLLLAGGANASEHGEPATWVDVLKLVLGAVLALAGVRQWRGRPRAGETAELPKWVEAVDTVGPGKAAGMAFLLAGGNNTEDLVLVVAAAAAIAQAGLDAGQQAIALAVFVAIGTIGAAVPVVIYFTLGARGRELLDAIKGWMAEHNAAIMSVLCLVIGAKLVG